MDVQMRHRLAGMGTIVDHDAETSFSDAEFPRDFGHRSEHLAEQLRVARRRRRRSWE
jgi:hypothetical protein